MTGTSSGRRGLVSLMFLLGGLGSGMSSTARAGRIGSTPTASARRTTTPERPGRARFQELQSREQLVQAFNADRGKVRIVAFLAPSCSHCTHNAGELRREVLERIDTPDLAVYAIWVKVLSNDGPELVPEVSRILDAPRVRQYWDPERRFNTELRKAIGFDVNARLFDVFLVYGRDAVWESQLPQPGYWMHQLGGGVPGPTWNAAGFATQLRRGLAGEPFDSPR